MVEPPYVIKNGSEYTGVLVALFNSMMEAAAAEGCFGLGNTAAVAYYDVPSYGTQNAVTLQWDGLMGELVSGRANASAALLQMTAARLGGVSFTAPFTSVRTLALTAPAAPRRPALEIAWLSQWLWFRPYSWEVWASLGSVVLVTAVTVWAVDWLSPYGTRMNTKAVTDRRKWNLPNTWNAVLHAFFDRDTDAPPACSSRFIIAGFFFLLLFFVAGYESGLTSCTYMYRYWYAPGTGAGDAP